MNPLRRVAAVALVLAAIPLVGACAGALVQGARTVQIQRTAHGVAHIEAPDYESLAYGVAFAHAQDNICQSADHLLTIRGERSRNFGPAAIGMLGLRPLQNEQIDAFIRAHMDDAALAIANAKASDDAKALARGYVAGFNRYVQENVDRIPAPCKGQPWVRPMTLGDFHRLGEHLAIQLGVGAFAGAIVGARPPQPGAASAASISPNAADALTALDALGLNAPNAGSNGWAFGAEVTDNGRGIVLGNPHFPWIGINRWWQLHMTVPGKLDVMGATLGHAPLVLLGFNKDVAWTHTVSTGRRFTLYELTLVPGDPTSYVVDGLQEKMLAKTVRFEAKGADGQVALREVMLWSSRWGPLMVLPRAGLNWTPATAYALQDATASNPRSIDTWLAIDRAQSVGDVRHALSNLGAPWVNTIAADRYGNALYADFSSVPDVDAAQLQRCAPSRSAAALFAGAGIVVLNGSRADCAWRRDAASPVPGLTPATRMPSLTRRDWVQNSNDSFWLTNPAQKLAGFSPLIGAVDTAQGMRTRAAIAQITEYLRGPHGGGVSRKLGLGTVEALLFANLNHTASVVLDDLLAACVDAPNGDTKEACAVLKAWDRRNELASRGSHLLREWWAVARNIPGIWRVAFDRADPVNTPAGLNLRDDAVRAKTWEALAGAVTAIKAAGFAIDAPLGDIQGKATLRGRIPLHGGTSLEGVLNVIESDSVPALGKSGYVPTSGTSYLQAVTFDDRGPVADALLTYGQSSQPDSPFAYDQLPFFSRKEMQRLPFHRDDVARQRIGEVLRLEVK